MGQGKVLSFIQISNQKCEKAQYLSKHLTNTLVSLNLVTFRKLESEICIDQVLIVVLLVMVVCTVLLLKLYTNLQ